MQFRTNVIQVDLAKSDASMNDEEASFTGHPRAPTPVNHHQELGFPMMCLL